MPWCGDDSCTSWESSVFSLRSVIRLMLIKNILWLFMKKQKYAFLELNILTSDKEAKMNFIQHARVNKITQSFWQIQQVVTFYLYLAPNKGIRNPDSNVFLPLESGIQPNWHQPLCYPHNSSMVHYTSGVYVPYSFRTAVSGFLYVSYWQSGQWRQWKYCETGHTVFRPYPRRLESLNTCRCETKTKHSTQLF